MTRRHLDDLAVGDRLAIAGQYEMTPERVLGNGPIAVATAGEGVWAADARDKRIVRLDAAGNVGRPVGLPAGPIAIAADEGLWMASEVASALTLIEPASGVTLAAPILFQPALDQTWGQVGRLRCMRGGGRARCQA